MTPVTRVALLAALVGLTVAAGCTTTEKRYIELTDDGGPIQIGANGRIGQEGGSLRVTDPASPVFGAEITVPPGAVGMDTTITIGPASNPPATPFGVRTMGPVVAFGPASLSYAAAARVTLPYNIDALSNERLVVLRLKGASDGSVSTRALHPAAAGDGTSWEFLAGSAPGDMTRRLSASTDANGLYVVAAADLSVPLPGVDGGPGGGDGSPIGADGSVVGTDTGPLQFDNQPPVFAGLVSVELNSDATQAHLIWDAATDNISSAAQIRYRIYLPSFATIGAPQGETPPGATSVDLAVSRGVTYYFLVRAVDRAGNADSNLRIISLDVPVSGPIGKQLGQLCQAASECQSGFCADGVCCDGLCNGVCQACNNQGARAGRCDPAQSGTDPRGACSQQAHAPGTNLLCDGAQQCALCQPIGSTEICNDGIDNNGDDLVDGDDPACSVCGGVVRPPLCTTALPRVTKPDPTLIFPVQAVSAVYDPVNDKLAIGTNDQRDDLSAPLPYMRILDPVTGVVTADVQLHDRSGFGGDLANPQVALLGPNYASSYALLNDKVSGTPQYFDEVSPAGMLLGGGPVTLPIQTDTDTGSTSLIAVSATQLAHLYIETDFSVQTPEVRVVRQALGLGGTAGASVVVDNVPRAQFPSGQPCMSSAECPAQEPICNIEIFSCVGCETDQDCAAGQRCNTQVQACQGPIGFGKVAVADSGTDLVLAWQVQLGSLTQLRVARIGYTATTPTFVTTLVTPEGTNGQELAVAAGANQILVAYGGFEMQTVRLFTQQIDPATGAALGARSRIDTVPGEPIGRMVMTSNQAGGFVLVWDALIVDLTQMVVTRLDSTGKELSSLRVGQGGSPSAALQLSVGNFAVVANSFGSRQASQSSPIVVPICSPTTPQQNATCASAIPIAIGESVTGNTSTVAPTSFACTTGSKQVYYSLHVKAMEGAVITLTPSSTSTSTLSIASDCAASVCAQQGTGQTGADNQLIIDPISTDADYLIGVQTDGGEFILGVELGILG